MTTPGLPTPARPCRGCNQPTRNPGRCDTCQPIENKRHNESRGYYHSKEWAKLRRACLTRDYNQCVLCASTTGLTAHHIHARKQGGPDTLPNLVTLCSGPGGCHNKIETGDSISVKLLTQHLSATRQQS